MKGQIYVVLAIIILIIVAIFAVINVESVPVNYLFWTSNSPLILVILFSVLMGGLITAAVGSIKFMQLKKANKKIIYKNQRLQNLLKEHNLQDDRVKK